jgi:hypothetical protein
MGLRGFVLQQTAPYSRASSASTNSPAANDSTHGFFVFDAEVEQWDHRTSF